MNQRRCMPVPLRTTRKNDGGITDNHDATTVRYGTCMVKSVAPRTPMIVWGLMMIVILIFVLMFNLFGGRESIYELIYYKIFRKMCSKNCEIRLTNSDCIPKLNFKKAVCLGTEDNPKLQTFKSENFF